MSEQVFDNESETAAASESRVEQAIAPLTPILRIAKCELTSVSLRVGDDSITFDEWESLGRLLRAIEGAVQFWMGDWINAGEDKFGEQYAQAIDATGWAPETIAQYARIARQVPPHRRRAGLSFAHHREVADLEPAAQVEFLARAEEGDGERVWSCHKLRASLRAVTSGKAETFWLRISADTQEDRDALRERMVKEGRQVRLIE